MGCAASRGDTSKLDEWQSSGWTTLASSSRTSQRQSSSFANSASNSKGERWWKESGQGASPGDQRVEIAMMRTPDGHSRLELSRFLEPRVVADHRNAPVNALGYLRVMFAVDDIDETLVRLRKHGAKLVSSEVVQYEDSYRLCYIRGPEGLLIGLAQESASQ